MNLKEAYEKKFQAQLDEWDAKIGVLKARADKAKAGAQVEYYKQIEDLQFKKKAADKKLAELKKAGDQAWEDLKEGLERARDSMAEAIKAATSRFK